MGLSHFLAVCITMMVAVQAETPCTDNKDCHYGTVCREKMTPTPMPTTFTNKINRHYEKICITECGPLHGVCPNRDDDCVKQNAYSTLYTCTNADELIKVTIKVCEEENVCGAHGSCIQTGCLCEEEYSGDFCELANDSKLSGNDNVNETENSGWTIVFIILAIVGFLVLILGGLYYRGYKASQDIDEHNVEYHESYTINDMESGISINTPKENICIL